MNITALYVYYAFIALLALGRIFELQIARKHTHALLQQGAQEYGSIHYKWIVLTHSLWLLACVIEAYFRHSAPSLTIFILGLVLFLLGFSLRLLAIFTLGSRWTTRIIILKNAPSIQKGIYRYMKHPNYLGVILELAGVPLIFGNYWTAILISLINLIVLRHRMTIEENALKQELQYKEHFSHLPRLIPKI